MAQHQLPTPLSLATSLQQGAPHHEIQQYELIVQLCKAIVTGSHPKIKVPPHLAGKLASVSAALDSSPNPSTVSEAVKAAGEVLGHIPAASLVAHLLPPPPSSYQLPVVPGLGNAAAYSANSSLPARPYNSGATEINPIFLEKSDDLVRAEIQLQRQRLEKALKDQVDQRRALLKASAQSEPLPDLDLSDVLSKALTLVQASAPVPADSTATANTSAASDSFDENSYYSSQHNSPDSSQTGSTARIDHQPNATAASEQTKARQQAAPRDAPTAPLAHHQQASYQQQGRPPAFPLSYAPPRSMDLPSAPSNARSTMRTDHIRNTGMGADNVTTAESTSVGERSGEVSQSGSVNMMDVDEGVDRRVPGAVHQRLGDSLLARPPSPLVIAQDISPVAPQPSHVSALALGRQPPVSSDQGVNIPQGTSAQVTALRNEQNLVSSPDSSPQGARRGEKKKGKKRDKGGKKSTRQAPIDITYIKDEPRSPSPINAPSFSRPQKRQKRQAGEKPREQPQERQASGAYGDDVVAVSPAYPGPDDYQPQPQPQPQPRYVGQQTVADGYAYQPSYVEHRRAPSAAQPYPSPYGVETYPPSSIAPPPPPAAVPYHPDPPRSYSGGSYEPSRASVRPEAGRARSRSPIMRERATPLMAPPKAPTPRVVVDAYGRRYYEPPQPPPAAPAIRQSVPPPMRADDAEIIYERPIRAESRRPGLEWEENGIIYRRASPTYAAPRRVVTQPEYAVTDPYRQYRTREYSSRPMLPPPMDDYVQVHGGYERRPVEEVSREYATRATTVRPAEPVRYEVPRDYERVASVRPEHANPVYPGAPPADARREPVPPPRAYSVRPAEPHIVRREFSARPAEGYYEQPARPPPPPSGLVTYVDGAPRAAPMDMVYGEDPRHGMYR